MELDTFDNPAGSTQDAVDTFENMNIDDLEAAAKSEDDTKEEGKKETKDKKESDSAINQLKDSEEVEKEEIEEEDTEETEGGDKHPDDSKSEAKTEIPKGRAIKVKMGDEAYDLDAEATVKVKVDGKNEIVTIKDLMSNYSGKVSYDEKFQNFHKEVGDFKKESEHFDSLRTELKNDLTTLVKKIDNIDGSPLDAVAHLAEMVGKDYTDVYRGLFESMAEQFEAYSMMDEVEQRLFWTEKKLESQNKKQTFLQERTQQEKAVTELQAKIQQTKEQFGISDDDFEGAKEEFIARGFKADELSPEQVAEYAVYKPIFENAQEFCSQFEDDMSDDELSQLVSEMAVTSMRYPKLNETEALKIAAKQLGFEVEDEDDDVKALESKMNKLPKSKLGTQPISKRSAEATESFDDFEKEQYGW